MGELRIADAATGASEELPSGVFVFAGHGSGTRNFFDPVGVPLPSRYGWHVNVRLRYGTERLPEFKACVRSMGGMTKSLFGGL